MKGIPGMEEVKIYPWGMSMTRQWSPETGLYRLRDWTPEELAAELWDLEPQVQVTATLEIMAHGNPRKAAEFVRSLLEFHPEPEEEMRERYQPYTAYLFDTPLDEIPSKPSEFPSECKAAYIQ